MVKALLSLIRASVELLKRTIAYQNPVLSVLDVHFFMMFIEDHLD